VSNDFVESILADRFMPLMDKVVDSCQRDDGNALVPDAEMPANDSFSSVSLPVHCHFP